MPELKLKTVTRTQGNNQGLKDGSVKARTFAFEFVEIPVLIDGSAAWCGTRVRYLRDMERLKSGGIEKPTDVAELHPRVMQITAIRCPTEWNPTARWWKS